MVRLGNIPGVLTYSMLSKGSMGTRESWQIQVELVEPNKPTKQEWFDDLSEVGLADSTLRQGEPVTWESG